MSVTPTLREVMEAAIADRLDDTWHALPGQVTAFSRATRKVSVQPLLPRAYEDEEGNRQVKTMPVITEVPILYPGAAGVKFRFPVAPGSTGLLVFVSGSMERWLTLGREVDPADDRRDHLTDAVFIPGLLPFTEEDSDDESDDDATVISAVEVRIGGTDGLAKNADLNELADHVASLLVGGTGSSVHPSPPGPFDGTQVLKGG